jgi:hypothetical protein
LRVVRFASFAMIDSSAGIADDVAEVVEPDMRDVGEEDGY